LSETAIFSYKVDNIYAPTHDFGIMWNDETLNIDWNIDLIQLSEKDKNLSSFKDFVSPF
jgi:dTDP-4-dehydrorhamnose 3,5-epimerase